MFEQGINYYTQKLATETDAQRDCFKQLVEHTFRATNDILELGKQEVNSASKIQQYLDTCARKKEELMTKTQQLLTCAREGVGRLEEVLPREPPREPPR